MSQQLDSITNFIQHYPFLGPLQYGMTASLSTEKLTVRETSSGRDPSGLGRWSWHIFRGQVNASLKIATLYRTVPPAQGGVPVSVYSQHITLFNTKIE